LVVASDPLLGAGAVVVDAGGAVVDVDAGVVVVDAGAVVVDAGAVVVGAVVVDPGIVVVGAVVVVAEVVVVVDGAVVVGAVTVVVVTGLLLTATVSNCAAAEADRPVQSTATLVTQPAGVDVPGRQVNFTFIKPLNTDAMVREPPSENETSPPVGVQVELGMVAVTERSVAVSSPLPGVPSGSEIVV